MVKAKADEHLALARSLLKQGAVDHAEKEYELGIAELEPVSLEAFNLHFQVSCSAFPISYQLGMTALRRAQLAAAKVHGPKSVEYGSRLAQMSYLTRALNYADLTEELLDAFMVTVHANRRSKQMKELEQDGLYRLISYLADVKYQLEKMQEACDLYSESYRLVQSDLNAAVTDRIRVSLHYSYSLRRLKRSTEAEIVIQELERYLLWSNTELAETY